MQFEFATAQRVIFGCGCSEQLPTLALPFGSRIVFVTGMHNWNENPLLSSLQNESGCEVLQITCVSEPDISFLEKTIETLKSFKPSLIISNGGGSVMDSGKVFSIIYTNGGDLLDYLEVIGKGEPLSKPGLPHIVIPTTAGTGSEVTRNAVISVPAMKAKVSLRSPYMLPTIALVDPELTLKLPAGVTVSTGMDALTQVIEPLISRKANPLTDALCLQAMPLVALALPEVYKSPDNIAAREKMSLVSLYGGFALANAGLGVVHGFSAAISGIYPEIGHGSICAAILPAGFEGNRRACKDQSALGHVSRKIETISLLLSGGRSANGKEILEKLIGDMKIQKLGQLGVKREDFPEIIDRAILSSSMKGNPVELTREMLEEILEGSY